MRTVINEIKALVENIKVIANEENNSPQEVASMLQTGAAMSGNDRLVGLLAIAKRRV